MADGQPKLRPPGRLQSRLRVGIAWLHLWIGLTVGTLFALVSLAGSVLVFHTELLLATRPQLAGHAAVVDGEVMGRLLEHWGPQGLTALDLPRDGLPVWQGYLADGRRACFAPSDGKLVLMRSHEDDWLMWLHHWHVELLGGSAGKEVLGIVGWLSLALLLGGLYLWWPKRGRLIAHLRWHAGPPARRWLSWHRSSGALVLPVLALATLTGTGMVYSAGFREVLVAAFGSNPVQAPSSPTAMPGNIDWPSVLERASAALPDGRLARVTPPAPDAPGIGFRGQALGEWHPVGRSTVMVSRNGRDVLLRHDATIDRPGARMSNAIYPLHIAAVGGLPMKLLVAFAGLMPTFLLITGFLFWRRPRGRA